MKKSIEIPVRFVVLILMGIVILVLGPKINWSVASSPAYSPDAWFWQTTHTIMEAWNADGELVVVEGQVGQQVHSDWNIYLFGDGGPIDINANFADNMPSAVIPKNVTVRIIGEAKNGEVSVEGLEIMGSSSAQPDATIAQINSGSLDGLDVAVRGQVGNQIDSAWKYYDFHDSTGTAIVDFEDSLPLEKTPRFRPILVYGQVKYDGGSKRRIDNDTILLTSEGAPEPTATPTETATATATSTGPTATATQIPPTSTPTPTATTDPSLTRKVYLPSTSKTGGAPAENWVWQTTNTVSQINGGCCNLQVVVVEGKITGKNNSNNPSWNEYNFSDGNTIILDFEDEIPAGAIPINDTVRIIGKVIAGNYIKLDVFGLQTLGNVTAQADRTVSEINAACCEDQDVAVKGQINSFDPDFEDWMYFNFSDNTGSTKANLEDDLTLGQVPLKRTLLLYGEGDETFGIINIKVRLMLFAANIQ